MPAPAIVDRPLFAAAQDQLRENRTRARTGLRTSGYLLQGLMCCALCGDAFYGKTTRQRGKGHQLTDFRYYRCSGTDGYRFGGERICSNTQIGADLLETAIWEYVSKIVKDPGILDQEEDNTDKHGLQKENVDGLKLQLQKLRHGTKRLIDSLAEGVIDRDQFTARMDRTKSRIAEIEAKLGAQETGEGRRAHVQALMSRLGALSNHIKSQLRDPDWATRREIIRAIVQRIEIGPAKVTIVFHLPVDPAARGMEPIMVTLSRV
jgi:site-specific DNA recombinase